MPIIAAIPDEERLLMRKGQQKRIATPGQNQKHYLAGALHSGTGKIHYVSGSSKNSDLFIRLLVALRCTYRRAKTITLVLDNYVIHKSRKVERGWKRTRSSGCYSCRHIHRG